MFFTGDLTQHGWAEEFRALDDTLADLWAMLRELGSDPALVAVPGNHDLVRPASPGPAHRVLMRWPRHPEIHAELWDPESDYRQALAEVFEPYRDWWQRRASALPPGWTLSEGHLPGELSLSIPCGDRRIGVVGLNSAFVQLDDSDYEGRLCLHPEQLHGACGGDGARWTSEHDACFLLTHHPPDWLDERSRAHLRADIAPPGRFVAHLYGHMHEQAQYATSEGGAASRRHWQGASLFGLESLADGSTQRAHGYTAGRIAFAADHAELRLWPRNAVRRQDGSYGVGVDRTIDTLADGGTRPERIPMRVRRPRPTPPARASQRPPLQRPGQPYEEAWHVIHAHEEDSAVASLRNREPVVVRAPLHFGKTWFMQRVSARLQALEPELAVAYLDLDLADWSSLEALLRSVGEQLADAVGRSDGLTWPPRGTAPYKLLQVLRQQIKPQVSGRLLLVLDLPDELWRFGERDGFFGVIRSLAGQGAPQGLDWLTMFLSLSMAPALYLSDATRSPLNAPEIILGELGRDQIADLAARHGLAFGEQDIDAIMEAVGGHPYLVRHVLYEVASSGRALGDVLAGGSIDFHLRQLEHLLVHEAELCAALCKLMHGGTIDVLHRHRLEAAGIIVRDESTGAYRLRFAIYRRLLDRLCR